MRTRDLVVVASVTAAFGAPWPVLAQDMKPGLWEHAVTMKSSGGEMEAAMARMQEELARMPPEQRRQMEAMMAGRGIGMGAPGQASTMRLCITPEQAARGEMPTKEEGRCKRTNQSRSGKTVRFAFACEGEPPTRGEGEVTFVSSTQQRSAVTMTTTRGGRSEQMQMQSTSRWLGADCGNVKPLPR